MASILIYGAGPLGSLFAARLFQAGHSVRLLARGKRLAEVRQHGVVLRDFLSGQEEVVRVEVVEQLRPEDAYDVVLVIMRKNRALEILPVLAANQHTPNVVFLMNNAAGPKALIDALGKERVLTGFPMSAGYFEGHVLHYIGGSVARPMTIPLGEVDGQKKARTQEVARILESMRGYKVEIRPDMDDWHRSHVAMLIPGIAAGLYACGTDRLRFARTRDALILASRATKEAFRVLRARGVSLVPRSLRVFFYLPEPLVVLFLARLLRDPKMRVAIEGHANADRDELQHLTNELLDLARSTSVPISNIERLYPYFDASTPTIPSGSRQIPLRWW